MKRGLGIPDPVQTSKTPLDDYLSGATAVKPKGVFRLGASAAVMSGAHASRTIDLSEVELQPVSSASLSTHLLRIGDFAGIGQSTIASAGFADVASLTAAGSEGATTLTLTGAGTLPSIPGYYIIAKDTAVVHNGGGGTYYTDRELIHITSVVGSTATLAADSALGRDYSGATLHDVTSKVIRGCTFYMPKVIAYDGTPASGSWMINPVWMGFLWDCTIHNPRSIGHEQTGVQITLSRGCTIHNGMFAHSNRANTGYGLSLAACVEMEVIGNKTLNARKDNLLQLGCSRITYRNAVLDRGSYSDTNLGHIDASHGFDERSILIQDCIGALGIAGNGAYRLGSEATFRDCNFYKIQGDCGATITAEDCITMVAFWNTEAAGSDSYGIKGATELTFTRVTFNATSAPDHALFSTSSAASTYWPNITMVDCNVNGPTASGKKCLGATFDHPSARTLSISGGTWTSDGTKAYIEIGGSGAGPLNITLTNVAFTGSTGVVVAINGTVTANITHSGCTINGVPMTNSNIYKAPGATATGNGTPL